MARRKKKNQKQEEETLVDVVSKVETAQDFVEQNKNMIMTVVGVIILVVAGVLAYLFMYKAPLEKEAAEIMQYAQNAFDNEQYAIALEGDTINENHGFLDIMDNFGGTDASNLANYYAGICYLNLGNYDIAKGFLNDYSPKGDFLGSFKYAALGDCYSELNEMDNALSNYKKATKTNKNEYATPLHLLKLGMFQENQGNAGDAKATYSQIMDDYPNSPQAIEAEKYLTRVGG